MNKSIDIIIDLESVNKEEKALIDQIKLTAYGELVENPPSFELFGRVYKLEQLGNYGDGEFILKFFANQKP